MENGNHRKVPMLKPGETIIKMPSGTRRLAPGEDPMDRYRQRFMKKKKKKDLREQMTR